MSGMTWVGFDVHARSTHGAAIQRLTGELERVRFGPGIAAPVAWLTGLLGRIRPCSKAGPTGFGLFQAATAAGIATQGIAPGRQDAARASKQQRGAATHLRRNRPAA